MLVTPLEESDTLELKREWSGRMKGLEDLAAFANTHGGTLVIGVDDDGETVFGFDPGDGELRALLAEVVDQLRLTPEVRRVPTPDGRRVVTLTVHSAPALVAYRGRYLTRVGSTNRDMTPDEVARRALDLSGQSWDALPGPTAFPPGREHPELQPNAVRAFLRLARRRLPHASPDDPPREVLEHLRLVREDRPNRAAYLLFGRRPQDVASGAVVQVAHFKEGRLLNDRTLEGTVLQQLQDTLDTLRSYLGVGYQVGDRAAIEGDPSLSLLERLQRAEQWPYPLEALREALVNALIHREYTRPDRIQVRVSEDELDVWSPGGLPAGLTIEALRDERHPSRLRNPHVAEAFYLMDLVERWGTGTTRMVRACRERGLPDPVFAEDSGGVRVTFRRAPAQGQQALNARQLQALTYVRERGSITNTEYRTLTGASDRTASQDLRALLDADLLRREGQGRGTRYRLNDPSNPQ